MEIKEMLSVEELELLGLAACMAEIDAFLEMPPSWAKEN